MQTTGIKKGLAVGILLFSCSLAVGCASRQYATPEEAIKNACSSFGPKALSGALIGGVAGAAGGAAIGAAVGRGSDAGYGALAGLIVGLVAGAIAGNIADEKDCQQAQQALQAMNTAKTGDHIYWNNSISGSYGSFVPVSDAKVINERTCREIRSDYYIKNHRPVVGELGLVCRTPDGDWARVAAPS